MTYAKRRWNDRICSHRNTKDATHGEFPRFPTVVITSKATKMHWRLRFDFLTPRRFIWNLDEEAVRQMQVHSRSRSVSWFVMGVFSLLPTSDDEILRTIIETNKGLVVEFAEK